MAWMESIHVNEGLKQFNPPLTVTSAEETPPAFDALVAWRGAVDVSSWWLNSSRLYSSKNNVFCASVSSDLWWIATHFVDTSHEVVGNETSCMVKFNYNTVASRYNAHQYNTHLDITHMRRGPLSPTQVSLVTALKLLAIVRCLLWCETVFLAGWYIIVTSSGYARIGGTFSGPSSC